jgi:putative ABC transport system permease protein
MAEWTRAPWLADLVTDVSFGFRMLRRSPGFAIAATLTLALGIGANTAMFSVADALLFRPPPFDHPERVHWIYDVNSRLHLTVEDEVPPSPGNFIDWRRQRRAFDYVIAWRNWFFSVAGARGRDVAPDQVRGVTVSPGFFEMLGVHATLGRTFRSDEEEPDRGHVVVLADGFWQRHFGGDPAIVGQSVLIDGRPVTVIGVLPKTFYFLWRDSAIFMPMTVDADFQGQRATHSIAVLARLAPGVTRSEAHSELERLGWDLGRAYPATNDGWSAGLVPVFPLNKSLQPALLMLVGAVGCVLLMACINVGNLMLVRSGAREREMTVRTALGASRGRLIRQLLAESGLLAVIGAAIGVPLAAGMLRALSPFIPDVKIAGALGIGLDARVLSVTLAVTLVTTVLLGTLPILQTSRTDRLRVPGDSYRRATAGTTLLTIEVALSFMLLMAATLLVKSLWNLERVDPGFRADRLTTMQVWLPPSKYPDAAGVSRFYAELLRRVQQIHEVSAAAVVNTRPFLGWSLGARLQTPGHASPAEGDPIVDFRVISPGYLAALRSRLMRGRSLDESDGADTMSVALINNTMARRYWPSEDPIGKTVRLRLLGSKASAPWWPEHTADEYTIVGVIGDIKESRLGDQVRPVAYLSYSQNPSRYAHLLIRADGTQLNVLESVQRQLHAVDPDLGVYDVQSMESVLDSAVASPRLNSILLWVFAVVALVLCAVGVYGVTSYVVSRRAREFAIRLAIGAQPSTIFKSVTRDGGTVALVGIAIGACGALLLGRLLSSLVFGVAATDPATFMVSAGVVFAVAMVACWRPAWCATRVDPMTVLRAE